MTAVLKNYRGVLFDMDGVLLFSNEIHSRAYIDTFEAEGVSGFDHKAIAGMRTDEVVRKVLQAGGRPYDADEVARVTANKRKRAVELFQAGVPLLDKCQDLLIELRASGLKLALATSASHHTVDSFLGAMPQKKLFDFVINGTQVANGKPAPDIFLAAAAGVGLKPADCAVVEDSLNGIQAAQAAGCDVFAVRGTCPEDDLLSLGPVRLMDSAWNLVGETDGKFLGAVEPTLQGGCLTV